MPESRRRSVYRKIDELFRMYPDGITLPAVKELVKEVRALTEAVLCYPLVSQVNKNAPTLHCLQLPLKTKLAAALLPHIDVWSSSAALCCPMPRSNFPLSLPSSELVVWCPCPAFMAGVLTEQARAGF